MGRKLLKNPMSYCRNNGYLMIGVCLGLTISLLFSRVEIDENDKIAVESSWHPFTATSIDQNSVDEYIPKINIDGKPQKPQKSPKSFIRPRYYYTELGIREKLFVGVLTSQEYLHSRGVVFNRTVAHLVEKIRYFISIPEGTKKPNVTLSGIVGFTDTRSLLKPFHVIKYITDNYLEDYDYYYIVKDTAFVNARRLMDLVTSISVSKDIHLGISTVENTDYCSLEAGVLLSNSIVRKLKSNLDWCVKNSFSSSDDVNFGRCIEYATKIPCTSEIDSLTFHAEKLPWNFDFSRDLANLLNGNLQNSISVFPLYDHQTIYRMNAYFTELELMKIQQKIRDIRVEIVESLHLGPVVSKHNSWPIGNQPGNKAPGRFDILHWNYFNATHMFMSTEFEEVGELIGSTRLDIHRTLQAVMDRIKDNYENKFEFSKLLNGYQKFDASRGMDYIFDVALVDRQRGGIVNKRIQVCKPLGKVEILSVPYVTENTRINMILTVDSASIDDAREFIEQYATVCMEKRDKTSLLLVLLYDLDAPSKGINDVYYKIKIRAMNLTDKYRRDQLKITWLSIRLPMPSINMHSNSALKIPIADLVTKKYSPESLLLFVQPRMQLKVEYLNRIRMNTINAWQIFSPIPFVEFHPSLAYDDTKVEFDLNRNHGRYDDLNYESISFYAKDYLSVRRVSDKDIPVVRTDKDISVSISSTSRMNVNSIFDLFIVYSDFHIFRAVEPALKIYYSEINCTEMMNDNMKKTCESRRIFSLGHRGQLAKLIKQYENS